MGDFSFLSGPYGYEEATQGKEWNSLHALKGIRKEERSEIICISYLELIFYKFCLSIFVSIHAVSVYKKCSYKKQR